MEAMPIPARSFGRSPEYSWLLDAERDYSETAAFFDLSRAAKRSEAR
jgi:hypothetical protein